MPAFTRPGLILSVSIIFAASSTIIPRAVAATHTVDIGGAFDGLFLGDGWEPQEGPYPQSGGIWLSRCRWARQGAKVNLPVFPGVNNRLSIRADLRGSPDQRLRLLLDGRELAEFAVNPGMLYEVEIPAGLLRDSGWAELTIETKELSRPLDSPDQRDLRAAVDWIRVSADAPARDFVREVLDRKGVLTGVKPDSAPSLWRFRYDPNNVGNRYRPHPWKGLDHIAYDDSGLDLVPSSHVPAMTRGDAAWYRAWLLIDGDPQSIAAKLRLPGQGFEKQGLRQVWVNGVLLSEAEMDAAVARALVRGPNLVVVRLFKGPARVTEGAQLVRPPVFRGRLSGGKVFVTLEGLTPVEGVGKVRARLVAPGGRSMGLITPGVERELTEFGEHRLVVEDDRGRQQAFPVCLLGVHFFHWGWYNIATGTDWRGFTPMSNDYVDQLLSRIDDWGQPHHSISWPGAMFAPGTGFHATRGRDYPELFRDAVSSGKLDLVGMPYSPRNVCTDFGETLIRSIRRSREVYRSVLGYAPVCFISHDATLTPMLPQILRLCGYECYIAAENWWGQKSVPNSRDCLWSTPDGSTLRMLDSYYHGISVTDAVRRAIEQGKPAVLSAEEFACLDATVFLEEAEWSALAREGMFLKPVSLARYRQITGEWAARLHHRSDAGLAYKGWTGGSEGEVELEKASRALETALAALENLVALARRLGIPVDRVPIDEKWDGLLRWQDCHLRFGNGDPEMTRILLESAGWSRSEMQRLGASIAGKLNGGNGVTVFNPLGFRRGALVGLELPEGGLALQPVSSEGALHPLQPDPDSPGRFLAALPDLPSIGCRGFRVIRAGVDSGAGARAWAEGGSAILDNGLLRIRVSSSGELVSVVDGRSGRVLAGGANRLFFARRHDLAPDEPLSRVGDPLNLAHYVRPAGRSGPRVVCAGPVLAAVECDLEVPDYPGLRVSLRIGLAQGERQARIRLTLHFETATPVCPRDATDPHEGTYLPGIFAAFPVRKGAKPVADMAYCLTDDVLASTNHDTFLNIPFRNGTFNALSLAGPDTEEFAVLTRGLTDFFVVREPDPFLALSFGMGTPNFPYREGRAYLFEYALLAPAPGPEAYRAAQGYLVDAFAVTGVAGRDLSLVESSAPESIIAGVDDTDGEVLVRVVNLSRRDVNTSFHGLLDLGNAAVAPGSMPLAGHAMRLLGRSIRELRCPAPVAGKHAPDGSLAVSPPEGRPVRAAALDKAAQ